jgi:hypothetical protein
MFVQRVSCLCNLHLYRSIVSLSICSPRSLNFDPIVSANNRFTNHTWLTSSYLDPLNIAIDLWMPSREFILDLTKQLQILLPHMMLLSVSWQNVHRIFSSRSETAWMNLLESDHIVCSRFYLWMEEFQLKCFGDLSNVSLNMNSESLWHLVDTFILAPVQIKVETINLGRTEYIIWFRIKG